MLQGLRIALIIPALDEAEAIGDVLAAIDRTIVDELIVVDNGSEDGTDVVAQAGGAAVVYEPCRGYGRACLAGIDALRNQRPPPDVIAFADADGSDDVRQLAALLAPIAAGAVDFVVGSRVLGQAERGALTPLQRFGNALTCNLVALCWGTRFTDLGPFRAIRFQVLERLQMVDTDFGWTIEMQVKAAQRGIPTIEVPVRYRCRRAGKSKISGTLRGSYLAGKKILGCVARAKVEEMLS